MLPLARIGFSGSSRTAIRAAIVVLAWLALWFSALVATLERPASREAHARAAIAATPRA
jgi:hypothetical protein